MNMCKALDDLKEEGREEGKEDILVALVQEGSLSIEKAAEKLNVTVDEFRKRMNPL